jgi:2',3'-cyclic-nucleotide 2'-phosphodiesterase (5'-nucleotidase family)
VKWFSIALVFAGLAAASESCPVPPGAIKIALPSGLPPALSEAVGNVALPGEAFDSTDVYVKGHKHSRYIFVWNIGSRWIVATEDGGKVLRTGVRAYDLNSSNNGKKARLTEERTASPTNYCAAATSLAAADKCPVRPGAVKVALPSELPPAVSQAVGNIALPGEPFDTIDVFVKGHKHSRYIFVWKLGNRWIVATEQGGIALRAAVSVYELRKEGKSAVRIAEQITFPESVCAAANALSSRFLPNPDPK